MDISAAFFPLVDQVYDYFTTKRRCSVQLPADLFDDRPYCIDEFYDTVQPLFDRPECFYTALAQPFEKDIKKLYGNTNNETVFSYPSPAVTKWNENNTAFLKLFSNGKQSETLLLFAPGWARKDLVKESGFCQRLLKYEIDSCLLVKPFHQ